MGIPPDLEKAATERGLKVVERGQGHFQITGGPLLVNNRKPFIWATATLRDRWGGGGQGINNPHRLTVGCEFVWKAERVTVTSFNDVKGYFVAQSYTRPEAEDCPKCGHQMTWPKDKILHQYKITHEDLKAAKAERKPKEVQS